MAEEAKVKWEWEADYIQACNCDYGCPCEFEAPPTMGFCHGMGAWRINSGRFGDVSLDGLGVAFVVHFPKAMHEGNGTLAIFIDENASEEQREALLKIGSGEAGGVPFEIFPALMSKILDPEIVPFQFDIKGQNSSAKIGDVVAMAFEPIKNPVTGDPESVRIEHETGFIFQGADVVSARECRSSVPELDFSYPDKCGFVTQVKYGN